MSDDGSHLAWTLERGIDNPDGHPRIPAGTYAIDVRRPPFRSIFDVTLRDPRYLGSSYQGILWLPEVAGRSNIEIHPANWYSDLEGCIALGDETSTDQNGDYTIMESRKAYCRVYPLIISAIKSGIAKLSIVDEQSGDPT